MPALSCGIGTSPCCRRRLTTLRSRGCCLCQQPLRLRNARVHAPALLRGSPGEVRARHVGREPNLRVRVRSRGRNPLQHGQPQSRPVSEREEELHEALAEGALAHDEAAGVVAERSCEHLARAGAAAVGEDGQRRCCELNGEVVELGGFARKESTHTQAGESMLQRRQLRSRARGQVERLTQSGLAVCVQRVHGVVCIAAAAGGGAPGRTAGGRCST